MTARSLAVTLPAVLVTLAGGCRYQAPGPPQRFPVTAVEGTIQWDGQPVAAGWVTVLPIGPSVGNLAIAPIGDGGVYRIENAPVGPLAVRISLPRSTIEQIKKVHPRLANHLRKLSGPDSPLRTTSRADRIVRFDYDLARDP